MPGPGGIVASWWEFLGQYAADVSTAACAKGVFAFCLTMTMGFFGLAHPPIEALMLLMLCDYALGFAHAWQEENIDVGKMRRGLGKFVGYALALNIAWLADRGMGLPTGAVYSMRNLLCAYLVANEAISALTHLAYFGVPVPVWLMERLRSYRSSVENPKSQMSSQTKEGHDDCP